MSENNVIQIGTFKYTVLKVDGKRVLLSWIESTGIEKQRWIIMKQDSKPMQKAA